MEDVTRAHSGRRRDETKHGKDVEKGDKAWNGRHGSRKRKRESEEIEVNREKVIKLLWGGTRKHVKDCTADFDLGDVVPHRVKEEEKEDDPKKIAYRKKQIEIGKNTVAYQCYIQAVPKHKRKVHRKGYPIDPVTPDINKKCSKRCFDGLLKSWRRQLHKWSPDKDNTPTTEMSLEPALPQPAEETTPSQTIKRAKIAPVTYAEEKPIAPAPVPSIFDGWFEEERDF
uniref:Histone RNA hairpin-binding protein RNA-binding domain-containing protein n=1 Tax=Picocystis salinarum TaxID=88271 RepID=A0A6U9PF39_9CHLO|mmetsp:Transcript_8270/g.29413  ORF Transcript_8270/g.29413 Transcript_8270/m.29413 type:complete len:227 (+) Transcript_8270:47-727(+)